MRKVIAQLLWLVLVIGTAWPQAQSKPAQLSTQQVTAPATAPGHVQGITNRTVMESVCIVQSTRKARQSHRVLRPSVGTGVIRSADTNPGRVRIIEV